jgi:alpha-D-ribose 1-methylphosphonate 5-triphosphate synthase subunit PhnH
VSAADLFSIQRCYRAVLSAMAEPGTVTDVGGLDLILATLIDHEVRLARLGEPGWEEADFIVVGGGSSGGLLVEAKQGALLDPAQGATAIYVVDELGRGPLALSLSGPGVGPGGRVLRVRGLDRAEVAVIAATRTGYPRGVDVFLVDGAGRGAALPRSTRLEVRT